jgi:hypothetical protein
MNLDEIPEWLWMAMLGGVSAVTLWWRRQSAGLSFFQEATDDQRDELEKMMKERIAWLIVENERMKEEIKVLSDALRCEE